MLAVRTRDCLTFVETNAIAIRKELPGASRFCQYAIAAVFANVRKLRVARVQVLENWDYWCCRWRCCMQCDYSCWLHTCCAKGFFVCYYYMGRHVAIAHTNSEPHRSQDFGWQTSMVYAKASCYDRALYLPQAGRQNKAKVTSIRKQVLVEYMAKNPWASQTHHSYFQSLLAWDEYDKYGSLMGNAALDMSQPFEQDSGPTRI